LIITFQDLRRRIYRLELRAKGGEFESLIKPKCLGKGLKGVCVKVFKLQI